MATSIRYRARLVVPSAAMSIEPVGEELHPTRARAIKEGIDMALAHGYIIVDEVPVERKQKTEWVEVGPKK